MCFGQLACPCASLCTMTHPALGSVSQACTMKKNSLHLEERFRAFPRARNHLVLTQMIVHMGGIK